MVYLDVSVCLGTLCDSASRQLEGPLVFGGHDRAICRFFRCGLDNFNFLSSNLVNNPPAYDEFIQPAG